MTGHRLNVVEAGDVRLWRPSTQCFYPINRKPQWIRSIKYMSLCPDIAVGSGSEKTDMSQCKLNKNV